MSNFVYDLTSLPSGKGDLNPIPPGADPNKYLLSTEWNTTVQASLDLRSAIRYGKFHGYLAQAADPVPTDADAYFWLKDDGQLHLEGSSGVMLPGTLSAVGVVSGATPTLSTHLTTKSYVDNLILGLRWKEPVKAATVGVITLTGEQTIDDIPVVAEDRVLVKNQSPASGNGLYVVKTGAWVRTTDLAVGTHAANIACLISRGTTNGDQAWTCSSDAPYDIVGTDNLAFVQFSGTTTPTLYYQTVKSNGTGLTQRAALNFSSRFTVTDNSGNNRTDVELAASGVTPGPYTTANITVDAYGRVTLASSGVSSPLTTKGDLYTFSTTVDRLPVGTTDGQLLSVNSATATGLEWISPPTTSKTLQGAYNDSSYPVKIVLDSTRKGLIIQDAVHPGLGSGEGLLTVLDHDGTGTYLTVMGDGKIGIGTASPSTRLHVSDAQPIDVPLITVTNTTATTNYIQGIQVLAPNLGAYKVTGFGVGQAWSARNAGWMGFKYVSAGSTDNYLCFGLHTVDDVLVIRGNGNVGIGTTAPDNQLVVNGPTATAITSLRCPNANIENTAALLLYEGASSYWQWVKRASNSTDATHKNYTMFEYYNGSTWMPAFSIAPGGSVGVGHYSPLHRLHVSTPTADTPTITITTNSTNANFVGLYSGNPTDSNAAIVFSSAGALRIGTWADITGATWSEKVRVQADGKVGIGTSNPGTLLDIASDAGSVWSRVSHFSNTALNQPGFQLYRGRGSRSSPAAVQSGDRLGEIQFSGQYDGTLEHWTSAVRLTVEAQGTFGGGNTPADFFISTCPDGNNVYERMRIKSDGKVGIGTASPNTSSLLTVAGDLYLDTSSGKGLYFAVSGVTKANITWDSTNNWLNVNSSSTKTVINPNGAQVALGTTNCATNVLFTVYSDTNTKTPLAIVNDKTDGASIISFYDNAMTTRKGSIGYGNSAVASPYTSRMYLDLQTNFLISDGTQNFVYVQKSDGKVGIGTTSPVTTLDVRGGVRVFGGNPVATLANSAGLDYEPIGSGLNAGARVIGYGPDATTKGRLSLCLAESDAGDFTPYLHMRETGYIGLGTSSNDPLCRLAVNGSMAVGSYAGANTPPANSMIISGTVGIGLTNPNTNTKLVAAGCVACGKRSTITEAYSIDLYVTSQNAGITVDGAHSSPANCTASLYLQGRTSGDVVKGIEYKTDQNGLTTFKPSDQGSATMTITQTGRVGVGAGATTPASTLHVASAATDANLLRIQATSSSGYADFTAADTSGVGKISIGYGNSGVGSPLTSRNYILTQSTDTVFCNGSTVQMFWRASDGFFVFGNSTSPDRRVTIYEASSTPELCLTRGNMTANRKRFNIMLLDDCTVFRKLNDALDGGDQWLVCDHSNNNVGLGGGYYLTHVVKPSHRLSVVDNQSRQAFIACNWGTGGEGGVALRVGDATLTDSTQTKWDICIGGSTRGDDFLKAFRIYEGTTGSTGTRLHIASGGNVGIGTTSPTSGKLVVDVASASNWSRPAFFYNSSMTTTQYTGNYLGKADSAKNAAEWCFYYAGAGSDDNWTGLGLHSGTNNIVINGAGRVGIGSLPTHALMRLFLSSGAATRAQMLMSDTTSRSMFFAAGNSLPSTIASDADLRFRVQCTYANGADDAVTGITAMHIDTTGKVGIGTTSPDALLDVHGTGVYTGALTLGNGGTVTGGTFNTSGSGNIDLPLRSGTGFTAWVDKGTHTPGYRGSCAGCYDTIRKQFLVCGGTSSDYATGWRNDAWYWNGTTWTQKNNMPRSLSQHSCAWDSYNGLVVVWGGSYSPSGDQNREVYAFDGTNWSTKISGGGPSGGTNAGGWMVFDSSRNLLVVHPREQEVWEIDVTTWTWNGPYLSGQGPAAGQGSGAAYDPVRDEVVIFGGTANQQGTWTYKPGASRVYTSKSPGTIPDSRNNGNSCWWDPVYQNVMLGPSEDNNTIMKTYRWTGSNWIQVASTTPNGYNRRGAAVAFDSDRGTAVMYGGFGWWSAGWQWTIDLWETNGVGDTCWKINSSAVSANVTAANLSSLTAGSTSDADLLHFHSKLRNSSGTAFTAGSIPFAGTGGAVTQDNANLFWNNTDKRLGIGTASPDTALHLHSTTTAIGAKVKSTVDHAGLLLDAGDVASKYAFIDFFVGGTKKANIAWGRTEGCFIINNTNSVTVRLNDAVTPGNTIINPNGGQVAIGTATPEGKLTIYDASNDVNLVVHSDGGGSTSNACLWLNASYKGAGNYCSVNCQISDTIVSNFGYNSWRGTSFINDVYSARLSLCGGGGTVMVGGWDYGPAKLVVSKSSPPTAFGTPYIGIGGKEYTGGGIQTIGFGYTSGTTKYFAEIGAVTTNTTGNDKGDLVFATRAVTTDTAPSERLRITSDGLVGIGTASPDTNYLLTVNGTIKADDINGIFTATQEPTGFVNRTATLSFTVTSPDRTFTITGAHDVYIKGVKYSKTTASIQIADTSGDHFIYYNSSGVLSETTDFNTVGFFLPLIATVYWNSSTAAAIVGEERHGITMDGATHGYLHATVGARYNTGLALSSVNNTTFQVDAGSFYDEDILNAIGSNQTTCDVFYRDGATTWKWQTAQTALWGNTFTSLRYNTGTTLNTASTNNYVAYWVFASNAVSPAKAVAVVIGQRQDTSIANARANNVYDSLTFGDLPFKEMKLIYRVIYRNVGGTPTYIETQDYRTVSNLPASTYVATSHSTLSDLLVDTHTQYVLSAGRDGGQTVIGGTGTTDDLTLRATSGVGASGSDIIFQVGNNGATEAMRILYDGKIGIGTDSPNHLLDVRGAFSVKTHAAFAGSEFVTTTAAVQTTTGSAADLWTTTLSDNTLYWVEVSVIGRDTAGVDRAYYVRTFYAYRQGGNATLGNIVYLISEETSSAWDVTVTTSTNDIKIQVTGAASTTINWAGTIKMQAVSGNA